jgi:hypothetical protein
MNIETDPYNAVYSPAEIKLAAEGEYPHEESE